MPVTPSALVLIAYLSLTASAAEERNGYVGSEACAGCHTDVYNTWRRTRHAYSVLGADEAERAGYPLPAPRHGGPTDLPRSWKKIAYIVGGRQRISYADRSGRVLDTSYHHRTGSWKAFPGKTMTDCGACHFTGFGEGPAHPGNAAVPGRWAEINIGCESCHGPGARHAETYEKQDVIVDPSSAACGRCHTSVGRVLPKDDHHDTHDIVQVWNHDPHVTGLRFQSHNAFCARCHAPYHGHFIDPKRDGKRRVFSEDRRSITCIDCHDPHDLTHAQYTREKVVLDPPRPSKRHVHTGHDRDFMSNDYTELATTEQSCLQCHRGADRIDLDHANATCHDCHNTFHRNRRSESTVSSDPNHPRLSCRQCHEDADHLVALLFRDPDFLEPKFIHNLRTLPAEVRRKFGFRYGGLSRSVPSGIVEPPGSTPPPRTLPPPAASSPPDHRDATDTGPKHPSLAADSDVRALMARRDNDPGAPDAFIELAHAYAGRHEPDAVIELLELAIRFDAPRILAALALDEWPPPSLPRVMTGSDARRPADSILSPDAAPAAPALRAWVNAWAAMRHARFADAARILEDVVSEPYRVEVEFHLGLARLGEGRIGQSARILERVCDQAPRHRAAQVALGLAHLRRGRFAQAVELLEAAARRDIADPIARYLLGQARMHDRQPGPAIESLQAVVRLEPKWRFAWLALARHARVANRLDVAVPTYRQIIDRWPDDFRGPNEYGMLLKHLSDVMTHDLRHRCESTIPPGRTRDDWKQALVELEEQASRARQLALTYFRRAIEIVPGDVGATREIAEIHRRDGRRADARRQFEWLARQEPAAWRHSYRIGTIHLESGNLATAVTALQHAVTLAPHEGDPYVALGLAYIRLNRHAESIETLERGAIYQPFNPALYNNLGAAFGHVGDAPRAATALERALSLGTFPLPRLHLVYTNLGLVHWKEGRREVAVKALKTALHHFADYAPARAALRRIESGTEAGDDDPEFVYNDLTEPFGEISTISFDDE